jgi:hypothetical protein
MWRRFSVSSALEAAPKLSLWAFVAALSFSDALRTETLLPRSTLWRTFLPGGGITNLTTHAHNLADNGNGDRFEQHEVPGHIVEGVVVLVLSRRRIRVLFGFVESRIDDSSKREDVMLKSRVVRRKGHIDAQYFFCVTQ